ncbi:uncharacterized protein YggU (UPF0235/DUF167 family) [Agromyces cerinus]|uniref:DUF167 domain-containing protein n=1 Tax=Agromyces cerinus TaxID=33878 RepID=UPI001958D4D7|nr:uncharacterized protein YggU (UPF0235/DUF167 family) [Agromyces cerinus]
MDVTIRVKPGSRKGPLVEALEGDPAASLTVFVRERAVDGAANVGVVAALATHFGVPRSRVHILRGESSRVKRVRIDAD